MRLIDADAMREEWLENGENEYVYDTNAFLESIDEQPTIEAVPVVHGWIPCSERLPEEEGMYYITAKVFGETEVQYVFFLRNLELFICNGIPIAWMPLPEPYTEQT